MASQAEREQAQMAAAQAFLQAMGVLPSRRALREVKVVGAATRTPEERRTLFGQRLTTIAGPKIPLGPPNGTDWAWRQSTGAYLGDLKVGSFRTERRGRQIIKSTHDEQGNFLFPGHDPAALIDHVDNKRTKPAGHVYLHGLDGLENDLHVHLAECGIPMRRVP